MVEANPQTENVEQPHLMWNERMMAIAGTMYTEIGLEIGYKALRNWPQTDFKLILEIIDNPWVVSGTALVIGGFCLLISIPYRGPRKNEL